jgi:hypothetical protein
MKKRRVSQRTPQTTLTTIPLSKLKLQRANNRRKRRKRKTITKNLMPKYEPPPKVRGNALTVKQKRAKLLTKRIPTMAIKKLTIVKVMRIPMKVKVRVRVIVQTNVILNVVKQRRENKQRGRS